MVKREEAKRLNEQFKKSLNYSGEKPLTPILDTINYPIHMKNLSIQVKIFIQFMGLFPVYFILILNFIHEYKVWILK